MLPILSSLRIQQLLCEKQNKKRIMYLNERTRLCNRPIDLHSKNEERILTEVRIRLKRIRYIFLNR